jgi:hypothetical protein
MHLGHLASVIWPPYPLIGHRVLGRVPGRTPSLHYPQAPNARPLAFPFPPSCVFRSGRRLRREKRLQNTPQAKRPSHRNGEFSGAVLREKASSNSACVEHKPPRYHYPLPEATGGSSPCDCCR